MRKIIKFPALRLILSFAICSGSVFLFESYNANGSFGLNLLCVLAAGLISLIIFMPSAAIRKNTNSDFLSCVRKSAPDGSIIISVIYCAYFVFAAEYFLLSYTDMFLSRINGTASSWVIAAAILLVCSYGAFKGIGTITRCSVFILAFSFIAYLLFFCGNIDNLNFSYSSFQLKGSGSDFYTNLALLLTPCVTAVIFASFSGYTKNFKHKHILFLHALTALISALSVFFICFALGEYRKAQDNSFFTLAKSAHFGSVSGIESFCLSLSAFTVFLLVALLLACMNKAAGKNRSLPMTTAFSVVIFVLYLCADRFNSVKEILINPYILNAFTLLTAFVIPLGYIVIRRMKNA